MRNKNLLSLILKYGAMLLLLIPFIVIASTLYGSFHQPALFIILLLLIYLDAIIIIWLLFEIKRTFTLKKTALGLALFLIAGWIIALVSIFATKSASLIPSEHVFGSIYAVITATAIILGIYAWVSAYVYKRKKIDSCNEKTEDSAGELPVINESEAKESVEITADTAESVDKQPLNAKQRRKLKRQQKLHNAEIKAQSQKESVSELIQEESDITDAIAENAAQSAVVDGPQVEEIVASDNLENSDNLTTAIENSIDEVTEGADGAGTEAEASENAETENATAERLDSDESAIDNSASESADNEINEAITAVSEADNSAEDYREIAADTLFADDSIDAEFADALKDETLADEFTRVVTAFDDSAALIDDGYKPVKINVFENDTEIPSDIEIVKNEFIPSGKFLDYSIKDETRGMYEEIENENERKIALMTDLSKVIITSNVNATIVPIEYEILERTFENKLRQSDADAKEYYSVIKNKLLSYSGVKSRVSKLADTFKCNGEVICKITVSGKTLLVNLNLDCGEYDSKYYKFTDVGDMSKFADTPMRIKVKNKLALKRCIEIIEIMLGKKNIEACTIEEIDYASQYPTVENAVIFMNSIAHLIRRE